MATSVESPPTPSPDPGPRRRAGELNLRELLRYGWRQLSSMRTALILLLILALAAVPGSVIPQSGVDALKTTQWQTFHPKLTPIYRRLDLFDVYGSPWFAAIYLLLMVSLIGCILPRTFHYWKGIRAKPPTAPRNLTRLPDHAVYPSSRTVDDVLAGAAAELKRRHYRVVTTADSVSAEKGYLREVGNLIFHLSVVVVLVGFAIGSLFGFKGGVIVVEGSSFSNGLTQYDDFDAGTLFRQSQLNPFTFSLDKFDIDWLLTGPRAGMARDFQSDISYTTSPDSPTKKYDLRVNHPLTIGATELFLIGHGYAPVITVRDGEGNVVWHGYSVFLPTNASFLSFGVVKAQFAKPTQIGLQGEFFPTLVNNNGQPANLVGKPLNPVLSLSVYTGDLNMTGGSSQSVYALDTSKATELMKSDGTPYLVNLHLHKTQVLPDGLGSVTFDRLEQWNKIQISQTPGKRIALGGVVAALIGLLMSLFLRPRRVWVRARPRTARDGPFEGSSGAERTLVEVGALDRSGGDDTAAVLDQLVESFQADLGRARTNPRQEHE